MRGHLHKKILILNKKGFVCLLLCLATTWFLACGSGESGDITQNTVSTANTVQFESNSTIAEETTYALDIETNSIEANEEVGPETLELIMVGDMLMHTKVVEKGLQKDGSYNFDFLFENVMDKIQSADLAIVNQETILGGKELGISGYPCFNSPFELGDAEVKAGFDVILHATNHALDAHKSGLLNCINFWEENYPDISYLGIYASEEAKENGIYVYTQGNIKIAILNYTYGTNGISTPEGMPYAVNYLEEEQVIHDIQKAEELADFVIVCPHWGTEYKLGISKSQEKWTRLFLENGVDLVIGTHPHVIEPVEWVSDEEGNQMLVYYSLGNFVNGTSGTGSGVMNRMVGGMADVILQREEDGDVVIQDYAAIPLVCHWSEDKITTYYLSDYTEELAVQNGILEQDSDFSLQRCKMLVQEVWGDIRMSGIGN